MNIDHLFNTKDKAKAVIANFKDLLKHPGWQLLNEIVVANINVLQDQILDGFEDETKEQIDRKRDKLRAYKEIIGTPEYWIRRLDEKEPFKEFDDPYDSPLN